MKITEEWRMFDPEDHRTHPEGMPHIEVEFDDGRRVEGLYSRDLGLFSHVGSTSAQEAPQMKRWRYLSEEPEGETAT